MKCTCSTNFSFGCCETGVPGHTNNANTGIHYTHTHTHTHTHTKTRTNYAAYALAQTVPLLSKPRDKAMVSFEDSVGHL